MFFAEKLGPAITETSGAALFNYVKANVGFRLTVPAEELRDIVAEFVRADGSRISVDAALHYLANRGRIALRDVRTFDIAA